MNFITIMKFLSIQNPAISTFSLSKKVQCSHLMTTQSKVEKMITINLWLPVEIRHQNWKFSMKWITFLVFQLDHPHQECQESIRHDVQHQAIIIKGTIHILRKHILGFLDPLTPPHCVLNGILCGHFLVIKIQQWNKSLNYFLSNFNSFWSPFSTRTAQKVN